jgi:hypothetical protein
MASLLRGPDPRRGSTPAALAGGNAAQPARPGATEAAPGPGPSRLRAVDDRSGPGRGTPIRIGDSLTPPVPNNHPDRDLVRGPKRQRRGPEGSRPGTGPGGHDGHARIQTQDHGPHILAGRHVGRRRRLLRVRCVRRTAGGGGRVASQLRGWLGRSPALSSRQQRQSRHLAG